MKDNVRSPLESSVVAPSRVVGPKHASKYNFFKDLLDHNRRALTLMADLEETYYSNRPLVSRQIEAHYDALHEEVAAIVRRLEGLSGKARPMLSSVLASIQRSVRDELAPKIRPATESFVLPLERIDSDHLRSVGAKAANLAVIKRGIGLRVPEGFAISAAAYEQFITETGLVDVIDRALAEIDPDDIEKLEAVGKLIQTRIMEEKAPDSIGKELIRAYEDLEKRTHPGVAVAVRSSAVGEDSETSFAGQYTSILNVHRDKLVQAYKTVVASKYSASALSYRLLHGLDDRETPMCVLVLAMVDARESGVLYTADPVSGDVRRMKINAVKGIGEALVGGEASAHATYLLDKDRFSVVEQEMTAEDSTATELLSRYRDADRRDEDAILHQLWDGAKILENHFGRPLDIEWAVDKSGRLYVLQSRPLLLYEEDEASTQQIVLDYPGHEALIEGGKCVSAGAATGKVVLVGVGETFADAKRLEEDVILVTKTASPQHAKVIAKVKGIITDVGSITSHLASVAREFAVPALFDTQRATSTLVDGETITLWASRSRVYAGVVEDLLQSMRRVKRPIFASPTHLKMQAVLESISPLNLTDPQDSAFSPEGCRTIHDIIRFTHEQAMREMFGYGDVAERVTEAVEMKLSIPLWLYVIDLGGGLRKNLAAKDTPDARSIGSIPFAAILQGLHHPGINWKATVGISARNLMELVAGGAAPQTKDVLGSPSYALISDDYMNFNARFGYHFATVDSLCGEDADQNYVTLQFAGGVGSYYGKSLRIRFLEEVLRRLGFTVQVKGDLIEASLSRAGRKSMEEALDQLGRLLGSSRLMDMGIANPDEIPILTESFFREDYNFLERKRPDEPPDFYINTGHWRQAEADGRTVWLSDGSQYATWVSSRAAGLMGRFLGSRYQEFLDNVGAYYYFPLAVRKGSLLNEGTIRVKVRLLAGLIDQAGGIAFGIRDVGNYFAFRINALENNAILFEFKHSKRFQLATVDLPIASNTWHALRVETSEYRTKCYLNDRLLIDHRADRTLDGYVGLWTKADSLTEFHSLEFK
ncbi:MAG: pyruvate, phosphate dikinase [Deltaproteobacteria bacterium]|nr:pyruvate, phosphate dikinase [Deltaproteobacteria bacterium]